tara:strand:- start:2224 stop:2742 length:519 start_codon:yes stop_codon:yes gene_type:complete
MIIKEKDLHNIKENKVTLIKNFVSLEKNYDFNFISKLIDENEIIVLKKANANEFSGELKDAYQVLKINNFLPELNVFFDFLTKLLKYERHANDGVDLFLSLVSKIGAPHADTEDVFILGLEGNTIYRVFDTNTFDYHINKGDMIFIPKGLKHRVIALTPRIIASIGFFGERK